MTVFDTSVIVDYLVGDGVATEVASLLTGAVGAAPDVMVFEVLAVLRRDALRGDLQPDRAAGAVEDLGGLSLDLFSGLALRDRAWELRDNMAVADAMFVGLAERLDEPLATKDRRLAAAARDHTSITVLELGAA